MSKTRQQKTVALERLTDQFRKATSVALADYQGLTVVQVDRLRAKMREAQVTYIVAKKTLITKAAKDAGYALDAKAFGGMLGVAFAMEDEIAPARVLGEMSKGTSLKLMGGIFDRQIVSQDKVIALSKLPSKKQLLGQVVGTMYAPVSAFVRTLEAIRKSKEQPEAAVV
jgi:large subunit ribosomal protein L10